jgi:branched-chain amino acid transport system permease protein
MWASVPETAVMERAAPPKRGAAVPVRAVLVPPVSRVLALYLLGMGVVLVPMLAALGNPYWIGIVTTTYLMAGLAASWNIIGGIGGQFSLAHGVFFGIGAYVTARLYQLYGVSPWLTLLPGAVLAAAVAVLISWPTFRLRGPFFVIATMAFNQVAFVLANYCGAVTGGAQGVLIPFRAGWANMIFRERWVYAALMFGFVALVTLIVVGLRRSRLGYYLLAVREDEDSARASGINVLAVKLKGMALSAALTSCGGALFAMYLRFIDPPSLFSLLDVGLRFALLTLIGGIGTVAGPLLGAALVVPLGSWLQATLGGVWPGAHLIVLGVAMVLAARFMKHGIAGVIDVGVRRWRRA